MTRGSVALMMLMACAVQASEITSLPIVAKPALRAIRKEASNMRTQTKVVQESIPMPLTTAAPAIWRAPSFYWAVLHNWLYFLSLGMNLINVQFLVREVIDGKGAKTASAAAIALSGREESVDKLITFMGVGFLSSLSDVVGRRALILWSSLGFALTNLIQANTGSASSIGLLYLADFIDGCTSCMAPVCQAYVADCSHPTKRAANLGTFQGLSIGCAFILAFPIGGILGAKYGPRCPLYVACGIQLLNAAIALFLTPESSPRGLRKGRTLDLKQSNPIGALWRLFGRAKLLRNAACMYALVALARNSLDAQFVNYASVKFGWSQQQSGPVMVMVGLMLAIGPRVLVPLLGLQTALLAGLLIFASGLIGTGLAPTPVQFVAWIFVVSVGCMSVPALQALITNLANPDERGALLGALGSLSELTSAIASTMYAAILASFTSANPPWGLQVQGMHFIVGASFLLVAFSLAVYTFSKYSADVARVATGADVSTSADY